LEQEMDQQPRCVFVASGELQADQVRGFLKSAGIATVVRGESLRQTHGLTIDGLGAVEVLVADADAEFARALLAEADAGRLRLGDDADVRGNGAPSSSADE
jgi:hypothetical protein